MIRSGKNQPAGPKGCAVEITFFPPAHVSAPAQYARLAPWVPRKQWCPKKKNNGAQRARVLRLQAWPRTLHVGVPQCAVLPQLTGHLGDVSWPWSPLSQPLS